MSSHLAKTSLDDKGPGCPKTTIFIVFVMVTALYFLLKRYASEMKKQPLEGRTIMDFQIVFA